MITEVNAKAKASEGLTQFVQALSRREAPIAKGKSTSAGLLGRMFKRD
jgi:hypothetical protein